MGRLDFSIIDPRIKPLSERERFGGRDKNLDINLGFLQRMDREYSVTYEGASTLIDYKGRKTRYIGSKEESRSVDVLQCCKAVKMAVTKFQDENGKLYSGKYKQSWQNETLLEEFIISGGREVDLVDIKHCYWRILFINNIISEKLYLKYKGHREARLVAVGCLNKTKTIAKYKGFRLLDKVAIKNKLRWAWNFVGWFTYKAVKKAFKSCDDKVFAYHSDGLYVPSKYSKVASKTLKELDLDCEVVKYTIIGYNAYFTILKDNKTGELRRANLGKIKDLKEILPYIEMENNRGYSNQKLINK